MMEWILFLSLTANIILFCLWRVEIYVSENLRGSTSKSVELLRRELETRRNQRIEIVRLKTEIHKLKSEGKK